MRTRMSASWLTMIASFWGVSAGRRSTLTRERRWSPHRTATPGALEGTKEGTSRYRMGLFGTPWDGGKLTSDQEVVGSSPAGGARR